MAPPAKRASSYLLVACALSVTILLALAAPPASARVAAPEIRTSAANAVPRCVTPQRLMAFLRSRNPKIEPRFEGIAKLYKRHGEAWKVRWDYAFFQMAVETNFLSFRRGNGSWGDVRPRQNNFAGLGTTGGGVPGDNYPDVGTGVLAQIQHLVVYSGERIAEPVGARTRHKQDDILETMARLKRSVTFSDLSRRWAADRHYGAEIEWVAGSYRSTYCRPGSEAAVAQAKPRSTRAEALSSAAALGGPVVVAENTDGAPPVRTIWKRAAPEDRQAKAPSPTAAEVAPPQAEEAPQQETSGSAAPAPTESAQPQPPADAEPSDTIAVATIAVPAPVEVTPTAARDRERATATTKPIAFAFAAAMNLTSLSANAAPLTSAGVGRCRVFSASYGGEKTLLVRAEAGSETHYTALTVLEGFESSMLTSYLKAHAPGGSSLGAFDTQEAALAHARKLCEGAADEPAAWPNLP